MARSGWPSSSNIIELNPIKPTVVTRAIPAQSSLNRHLPCSAQRQKAAEDTFRVAADDHRGVVQYDAGTQPPVPDGAPAGGRDRGVAGPDHRNAPAPPIRGMAGRGAS